MTHYDQLQNMTDLQDRETQFPDLFVITINQLDNDINNIIAYIYLVNYR
jgi:hypothetical protein